MIYLDNAATSWPKPPEVVKAMSNAMERAGGNPGRSGHRLSIAAAREIYEARENIASLFHVSDPLRVILTCNATHAINIALKGLLKPGDRVVTTAMEHNAVMRPLRSLERQSIHLTVVPCACDGSLNVKQMAEAVDSTTRLVVMLHASNVAGTILPVAEVAAIAHQAGALLLVDAAQTAGVMPINMHAMGIDLLAFTGHKELQGPPGVGGLIIGDEVNVSQIEPLICGGTGSRSETEEQPEELPDKYEAGTPNLVGIAGLRAGICWLRERGIEAIENHLKELLKELFEGLSQIPQIKAYGTLSPVKSVGIVSFTAAHKHVSEIGMMLDEEYGILCRVGLHCAPAAHRTIGSFPEGTVRLAPGVFTTKKDIRTTIKAIEAIVRS